jgi:hypothetical protein
VILNPLVFPDETLIGTMHGARQQKSRAAWVLRLLRDNNLLIIIKYQSKLTKLRKLEGH